MMAKYNIGAPNMG